jgi:hypothetical protein
MTNGLCQYCKLYSEKETQCNYTNAPIHEVWVSKCSSFRKKSYTIKTCDSCLARCGANYCRIEKRQVYLGVKDGMYCENWK